MQIVWHLFLALGLIIFIILIIKYVVGDFIFLYRRAKVLKEEEPIFYRVNDVILDEKIAYIKEQIRKKRIYLAGVYKVPDDIQKELALDKFSESALQRLVDSIVAHTGVFNLVKVVIDDTVPENIAGLYTAFGRMVREIHLYRNNKYSVEQIMAILVHECTHNFLSYYNLELSSEEENEILTDVTAVYLGFGEILVKGYKPIKEVSENKHANKEQRIKVHKWRIGYLKLPDLVYLIRTINIYN